MDAAALASTNHAADNRAAVACAHCGLAVPPGLIDAAAERQFCCAGCRAVWSVIHECGLDRYYRLRERDAAQGAPAMTTGRAYEEYDDPAFETLHVRAAGSRLRSVELFVEGAHCGACVWLLEKLPSVLPFVAEARLQLGRSLLRVTWDAQAGRMSAIARMLDALGYPPHPARDAKVREFRRGADRRLLTRIAIAGAIAGNVMLLAFALYGGMFNGMEPQYAAFFRWISAALGVLSLAWPGSLFFRGAIAALRTRTAHLDLPIAIGLLAGGAAGAVNTALGRHEIYFDSLTVLVFALLLGRWVQRRQQRWASDALELLYSLTPTSARRVEAGGVVTVPIESIGAGDLVEIRAGDTAPVDGLVETGQSAMDQSLLTGESRPIDVRPGDRIAAGTVNVSAALRVRAEATGEGTRVGRLMALVESASQRPAAIVRLADRIAGWFTLTMLTASALTFAAWLWIEPARALDHAAALLIVTCPCALGLATPLVVTVAIGRAARRRILIKGGETLEALARPGAILLDKTGTLTTGRMRVLRWAGDERVAARVLALERHSAHPIARALLEHLAAYGETGAAADDEIAQDVRQVHGHGIEGTIGGRRIRVGAAAWLLDDASPTPWMREFLNQCVADGSTPIFVAEDGAVVAAAALGDPLRPDAAESVRDLLRRGWDVAILSGDHPEIVAAVGAKLGLPHSACRGGVTPEGKLAAVTSALRRGAVVMVGDGVNDSAALSAATVGIAVHGGAEASLAAADAYLNRAGLAPVVELLDGGRRTVRAIRRGLALSVLYNAAAAALAATGVINPLLAAILMPISSLSVVTLAFASRTFALARRDAVGGAIAHGNDAAGRATVRAAA